VFVSFSPEQLAWSKDRVAAGDSRLEPARAELLARAERALQRPPLSVVDKRGTAASGDKQDFYSIGKYSWPGTSMDGPYVRRDGRRNPEADSKDYDKRNFTETVRRINTLALAYHLSGDPRYARKAGEFLRAWFIDPGTRMNPNLRHAAVQPGVNDGSYIGIIEGVLLAEMLDYVALLEGSGALSAADEASLRAWFGQLSTWLVKSDFGKKEAASTNNHATWYRVQVMAYALYSGDEAMARSMLPAVREQLRRQITADGSMPREMRRANPSMYAVFGLRAFVSAARLSEHLGDSLWAEEAQGRRILEEALAFLARAQLDGGLLRGTRSRVEPDQYAVQVFRLGAQAYSSSEFNEVLAWLASQKPKTDRYIWLLGPLEYPNP